MKKLSTRFEVSASNFWVRNVKTSEMGQICQLLIIFDLFSIFFTKKLKSQEGFYKMYEISSLSVAFEVFTKICF
jgi:hypothetical protein